MLARQLEPGKQPCPRSPRGAGTSLCFGRGGWLIRVGRELAEAAGLTRAAAAWELERRVLLAELGSRISRSNCGAQNPRSGRSEKAVLHSPFATFAVNAIISMIIYNCVASASDGAHRSRGLSLEIRRASTKIPSYISLQIYLPGISIVPLTSTHCQKKCQQLTAAHGTVQASFQLHMPRL